jgi:uncharacterized protein YjbI with pentapeptide repeats
MMEINRRTLVLRTAVSAAATSAGAICTPHVLQRRRRVSQSELTAALKEHLIWLDDSSRGRRAMFANCDLGGLDFHCMQDELVNLRASDFTDADLTGITGNNLSFLRSSLHGAQLSWSHLKRPTFSYASLRGATCDNAVWGWNDRLMSNPARAQPDEGGVFFHVDAAKSNFVRASLRGIFVEASFNSAKLMEANMSYSVFYGQRYHETSFFMADLSHAKFKFAAIAAARFKDATCDGIVFADAEIGDWVTFPAGTTARQTV